MTSSVAPDFPQGQGSTFCAAIPYALGSLVIGTLGVVLASPTSSVITAIMGIAMALFGGYAFFAVVACGLDHPGNPEEFRNKVGKYLLVGIASSIADAIISVAMNALARLISGRDNHR